MNNSKNILYLTSLIILMLTGCEAETPIAPLPNNGEEPMEVHFHAVTVNADVTVSRANYEEKASLVTGDKIGIWNELYHHIELTYTATANPNLSTTHQEKIYYPYDTEKLPVYAYAPYNEFALDTQTNSVLVKSEWVEDTTYNDYITDPIWAADTISKGDTVNFKFTHQMARLKIEIKPEEEVIYSNYTLTFTFDRTQHGEMSLTNGIITPTEYSDCNYIERFKDPTGSSATGTNMPISYDHIILPGSKLKKIKVQFAERSGIITYEHTYTDEQPFQDFVAGKYIQMYIDFKKIKAVTIHPNHTN